MTRETFIPTEDPRVYMRRFVRLADDRAFHHLTANNLVWLSQHDETAAEAYDSVERITERREANFDSYLTGIYAAELLVGHATLFPDGQGGAEIGYFLDQRQTGKGLATLAARGITQFAIEHGFGPIRAYTHPDNWQSQRVLERTDYRHTAIVRRQNGDIDKQYTHGDVDNLLQHGEQATFASPEPGSWQKIYRYNHAPINNTAHKEGESVVYAVEPGGATEPRLIRGDTNLVLRGLEGSGIVVTYNTLSQNQYEAPQVRLLQDDEPTVHLQRGDAYYLLSPSTEELIARFDYSSDTGEEYESNLQELMWGVGTMQENMVMPPQAFYELYGAPPSELAGLVSF